jgi:hypothetical protein
MKRLTGTQKVKSSSRVEEPDRDRVFSARALAIVCSICMNAWLSGLRLNPMPGDYRRFAVVWFPDGPPGLPRQPNASRVVDPPFALKDDAPHGMPGRRH